MGRGASKPSPLISTVSDGSGRVRRGWRGRPPPVAQRLGDDSGRHRRHPHQLGVGYGLAPRAGRSYPAAASTRALLPGAATASADDGQVGASSRAGSRCRGPPGWGWRAVRGATVSPGRPECRWPPGPAWCQRPARPGLPSPGFPSPARGRQQVGVAVDSTERWSWRSGAMKGDRRARRPRWPQQRGGVHVFFYEIAEAVQLSSRSAPNTVSGAGTKRRPPPRHLAQERPAEAVALQRAVPVVPRWRRLGCRPELLTGPLAGLSPNSRPRREVRPPRVDLVALDGARRTRARRAGEAVGGEPDPYRQQAEPGTYPPALDLVVDPLESNW